MTLGLVLAAAVVGFLALAVLAEYGPPWLRRHPRLALAVFWAPMWLLVVIATHRPRVATPPMHGRTPTGRGW